MGGLGFGLPMSRLYAEYFGKSGCHELGTWLSDVQRPSWMCEYAECAGDFGSASYGILAWCLEHSMIAE